MRRLGAAAMILACGGAGVLSGCTSDAGAPVPIDPVVLYAQNCARCHGADGRGDEELKKTMPIRDLTATEFVARARTEDIERLIMSGRNQMPSFGGILSAPKVQAVAGHVRRLGKAGKMARP